MSSDAGSSDDEYSLSNPDTVTKYKAAAKITNAALAAVIEACRPGARVVDVCAAGDAFIAAAAAKEFAKAKDKNGKPIERGVAVPTCVSANNCCGHFSPLADDGTTLAEGDLVKIDLGTHIDGFIAQMAHSIVVTATPGAPATGRAADAIACAQTCVEAAARLMRPGHRASEVAPVLATIAEAYGCALLEGVATHSMERHLIDGDKAVLNRPSPEHRGEDCAFEEGEVYAIDVIVSTGDGKPKVLDERATTVFKHEAGAVYQLKLAAARAVLSEIKKKAPTPVLFTLRALDDPAAGRTRLGLTECLNHGLLAGYPVTWERPGALVAHCKTTVLLTPGGSDRITAPPAGGQAVQTDKACADEGVKALLATSLKAKKGKKAKKGGDAPPAAVPMST